MGRVRGQSWKRLRKIRNIRFHSPHYMPMVLRVRLWLYDTAPVSIYLYACDTFDYNTWITLLHFFCCFSIWRWSEQFVHLRGDSSQYAGHLGSPQRSCAAVPCVIHSTQWGCKGKHSECFKKSETSYFVLPVCIWVDILTCCFDTICIVKSAI